MMKLLTVLVLAAVMATANLTALPGSAAVTAVSADDFDADGYDGAWSTVTALDVEIFLPDGWTGEDVSEDGACYRAGSADGAAALSILYPIDGGSAGEVVSANGKEARLVRGDDGTLTVTMALSEARLAAFRFERASEDALSEALALQIAGSCTDVW